MIYDPEQDPEIIEARKQADQACIDAQAKADRFMADDKLATTKGKTPEQIEARKRVVATFFELHYPHDPPEFVQAEMDKVDYTQTVTYANGRTIDLQNPKGTGFMGMGRKPAYFVSKQFAPKSETDPIYALEYFPVKE